MEVNDIVLARGVIEKSLENFEWVVFGKSDCPWCDKACGELSRRGAAVSYHSLDFKPVRAAFRELHPDIKTVPQIFRDGKRIGGYDDLITYFGGQFSDRSV